MCEVNGQQGVVSKLWKRMVVFNMGKEGDFWDSLLLSIIVDVSCQCVEEE